MPGFMTPMPPPMGPVGGVPMKHPMEIAMEDEPTSKKARNEDSLVPEEVYMARNPVSSLTRVTGALFTFSPYAEPGDGQGVHTHAAGEDRMEAERSDADVHVASVGNDRESEVEDSGRDGDAARQAEAVFRRKSYKYHG